VTSVLSFLDSVLLLRWADDLDTLMVCTASQCFYEWTEKGAAIFEYFFDSGLIRKGVPNH
jgi:hypothetical protein